MIIFLFVCWYAEKFKSTKYAQIVQVNRSLWGWQDTNIQELTNSISHKLSILCVQGVRAADQLMSGYCAQKALEEEQRRQEEKRKAELRKKKKEEEGEEEEKETSEKHSTDTRKEDAKDQSAKDVKKEVKEESMEEPKEEVKDELWQQQCMSCLVVDYFLYVL